MELLLLSDKYTSEMQESLCDLSNELSGHGDGIPLLSDSQAILCVASGEL